jgi:predicted ATPase
VALRYSEPEHRLMLVEEGLTHHTKSDAKQVISFPHALAFRNTVVKGKRYGTAFLSTDTKDGATRIELHGDGGSRGRPVAAGPSPRTVLGGTNTKDYPTVVAARREMASWHSVHLEPSSLRTPDRFGESAPVDEYGRHIAATLRRLGRERSAGKTANLVREMTDATALQQVCTEASNQLARLVDSVRAVRVREDEVRQHYVVEVQFRDSPLWMPPRALSEGTLRYLALVTMQMDTRSSRLLCIEEPENGIEPHGIPALVRLLRDYAVDPQEPVEPTDNPLRQVLLNSHSRDVVGELREDEVLFVEAVTGPDGREAHVRSVDYPENWRQGADSVSPAVLEQWRLGKPRGQQWLGNGGRRP